MIRPQWLIVTALVFAQPSWGQIRPANPNRSANGQGKPDVESPAPIEKPDSAIDPPPAKVENIDRQYKSNVRRPERDAIESNDERPDRFENDRRGRANDRRKPVFGRAYSIRNLINRGVNANPLPGMKATSADDRLDAEALVDLLIDAVDPSYWEVNGGHGRMRAVGSTLVVTADEDVHRMIESTIKALDDRDRRSVSIKVDWIFPTKEEHFRLISNNLFTEPGRPVEPYDQKLLDDLLEKAPGVHGELMVFDRQDGHLLAGDQKLTLKSLTPAVSVDRAAFDPATYFRNEGAAIQIRPTVAKDKKSVRLDVQSFISMPSLDQRSIEVKSSGDDRVAEAMLRPQTKTTLRTSLSAPIGKPTLAGAATVNPRLDKGDLRVMCLILTAVVD